MLSTSALFQLSELSPLTPLLSPFVADTLQEPTHSHVPLETSFESPSIQAGSLFTLPSNLYIHLLQCSSHLIVIVYLCTWLFVS